MIDLPCLQRPRYSRGFTIVELLIVIVIVSILAAVAIPSYREYVMRTNRTVAKAALQELMTRQESYAVDHKKYAANLGRLGIGSDGNTTAFLNGDGAITTTNSDDAALYQLSLEANTDTSCEASTGNNFTIAIVATPLGSQDSKCGTLCLTSSGERGSSLGTAADCWRR